MEIVLLQVCIHVTMEGEGRLVLPSYERVIRETSYYLPYFFFTKHLRRVKLDFLICFKSAVTDYNESCQKVVFSEKDQVLPLVYLILPAKFVSSSRLEVPQEQTPYVFFFPVILLCLAQHLAHSRCSINMFNDLMLHHYGFARIMRLKSHIRNHIHIGKKGKILLFLCMQY